MDASKSSRNVSRRSLRGACAFPASVASQEEDSLSLSLSRSVAESEEDDIFSKQEESAS